MKPPGCPAVRPSASRDFNFCLSGFLALCLSVSLAGWLAGRRQLGLTGGEQVRKAATVLAASESTQSRRVKRNLPLLLLFLRLRIQFASRQTSADYSRRSGCSQQNFQFDFDFDFDCNRNFDGQCVCSPPQPPLQPPPNCDLSACLLR